MDLYAADPLVFASASFPEAQGGQAMPCGDAAVQELRNAHTCHSSC